MTAPPPDSWRSPPYPPNPGQVPPYGPPGGPWLGPPGQPPPPYRPRRNRALTWILGAVVLLVVVAVTVGATLFFTRGPADVLSTETSSSPTPTNGPKDIASADDRGPAGIITEDPTCAPWLPINDTFAAVAMKGWDSRDSSTPASAWTQDQRAQYDAIGGAMRAAADQTERLVKLTPHRTMRELYEQTIAYWRAYADKIPSYTSKDDHLAQVANSTSAALVWTCSAIVFGSAPARSPLIARAAPPLQIAPLGDAKKPQPFLRSTNPVCGDWGSALYDFTQETSDWAQTFNPNLPVSEWSPQQHSLSRDVVNVMQTNADQLQELGADSTNPVLDDFAVLAAQYQRAYIQALPTYTSPDNYLNSTAARLVVAIDQACKAVADS